MKTTREIFALGCVLLLGLMSGFFYAYSVDVMIALDRLAPAQAIEAMQSINFVVRNPVFFITFFLTPILCFLTGALLLTGASRTSGILIVAAGAFYLLFALLPTIAVNVPMNEALAELSAQSVAANSQVIWDEYSPTWTFWNTLRTITSLIATAIAGVGLLKYSA